METVEPIRSEKKIQDLKKYLIGAGSMRNYALVVVGINTALRVSDMLSLTWGDVYDFEEMEFKSHVYIKEMKTGKHKKFLFNKNAVEALRRLKKEIGQANTLQLIFVSRNGSNKAITRFRANDIIKEACAAVGIKEHIRLPQFT